MEGLNGGGVNEALVAKKLWETFSNGFKFEQELVY